MRKPAATLHSPAKTYEWIVLYDRFLITTRNEKSFRLVAINNHISFLRVPNLRFQSGFQRYCNRHGSKFLWRETVRNHAPVAIPCFDQHSNPCAEEAEDNTDNATKKQITETGRMGHDLEKQAQDNNHDYQYSKQATQQQ